MKTNKLSTLLLVVAIISSTNIAVNSSLNDNYSSGKILASSNNIVYGYVIYRAVENQDTSVATLETDFGGVAPFHPFFTQRLTLDGKSFYLSNSIAGFEIFNDANNNGYIDSVNEIVYFVMLNATQKFDFSQITKTTTSNMTTYEWTSHYYDIDGFPMQAPANGKVQQNTDQKKILIPSFNITYTLSETANNSKLAVKYDIGAFDAYTFHFDNNFNEVRTGTVDLTGLSLSLVYTSVIRSTEDVQNVTYTNGDTISDIKFVSNSNAVFESSLNDNYTLGTSNTTLPVKTVIASPKTLLSDQNSMWSLTHDYLDTIKGWNTELGNLTAVPEDSIPVKEMFNYRIAYPEWGGKAIHHDPVYQANKVGTPIGNTNGNSEKQAPGFTFETVGLGLMTVGLFITKKRKYYKF